MPEGEWLKLQQVVTETSAHLSHHTGMLLKGEKHIRVAGSTHFNIQLFGNNPSSEALHSYISELRYQVEYYQRSDYERRFGQFKLERHLKLTIELFGKSGASELLVPSHQTEHDFHKVWTKGVEQCMSFTYPTDGSRPFRWIHVPCNNPAWIPKLLLSFMENDIERYQRYMGREAWSSQFKNDSQRPHARCLAPQFRHLGNGEYMHVYVGSTSFQLVLMLTQ
jgi:hypothetical protein